MKQSINKKLESIITRSKEEDPNSDLYYDWGFTLLKLGDYEESILKFQKVLDLEPNDYESMNFIGEAHVKSQRYVRAIQYFKKAIGLFDESPEQYANLGEALFLTGELDEAKISLEKGLNLCLPKEEAALKIISIIDLIEEKENL